jgi:hypothetical protein
VVSETGGTQEVPVQVIESRRGAAARTIGDMILGDELRELPSPQPASGPDPAADLRAMALHLETAAALDLKAARATDPAQIDILRRRAEQRRTQAARIRARLAAGGAAVPEPARTS